ncbi:glycoside hydrolase family 1 protein, partial [bacterium]
MVISNITKKLGLSFFSISLILSACSSPENLNINNTVNANSVDGFNQSQPLSSFQWGVSTAGYQSEGNDSSSIWSNWDKSGKTLDHNPKGVDFFNRYEEDIQLAKDMGANSFRFSIEWSRVEPRKGHFDPDGIQFYRNILNSVKAKGMTPLVTLVHFNYPQWIVSESKNANKGLDDPEFINYFLKYTEKMVREFGDDVKYWITFNEPNIWIPGAYLTGIHPPGKKNPIATVKATWNLLKSHSKAYDLIHQLDADAMVSANMFYILPKPFGAVTPAPDNASIQSSNTPKLDDKNILDTDWFYESMSTGNVTVNPQSVSENQIEASNLKPKTLKDELNETDARNNPKVNIEMDSQVGWLKKFDYVAFDYYYRFRTISHVMNLTRPWLIEIYPEGLYDAIMYYHRKYNKPIMIAENGICDENLKPRADKWTRESAIVQHVKHMKRAMADGANVLGYYHWSITDNYEWGSFTPRFGLYTVNALKDPTMKRIATPAVEVYKQVIKNNGVTNNLLIKY